MKTGFATLSAVTALIALPLTGPATAYADTTADRLTFFISPSGNIGCLIDPVSLVNGGSHARCDIRQRDWQPPARPGDCPGYTDYGQGIDLFAGQSPRFVCAGDTAFGGGSVLAYGNSITAGSVSCSSAESGVTCRESQSGHGFSLSRQGYQLF